MVTEASDPFPKRKHPAKGVCRPWNQSTIVYITVCTEKRHPWLANDHVHELLKETWKKADAWFVGRYVVMPDHVHLFAGLNDVNMPLDEWVRYWKTVVSRELKDPMKRWQKGMWDTRLRSSNSYSEK